MRLPQDPVFIVGYPRSGTTLLQRILAAQPGIYTFPETHYFCVVEKKLETDSAGFIRPSSLPAALAAVGEKMDRHFSEAEQAVLMVRAVAGELDSKGLFEFIVGDALVRYSPELIETERFVWVEKTPHHALFLDRIRQLYPNVRVLHILRHPVPAICSRKQKFPFNRDLSYAELARRWLSMLEKVEAFSRSFPGLVSTLRYEDLVADPAGVMRPLLENLGISGGKLDSSRLMINTGMDRFALPSEPWKLNGLRAEIVDTNETYRQDLSQTEIAEIEATLAPVMKRLGYSSYQTQEDA